MFESVFTTNELIGFFDPYFRQCAWESQYLEVQSRNTLHYWLIIKDPAADIPYTLLHKHHKRHPYHKQCRHQYYASIIKTIKKHDAYVMNHNGSRMR